MATDTLAHNDTAEVKDGDWSGGSRPFKASYGKLMMWYFLVSDAFTFAGFLIAYGALRFSMPTWPVPDFVFSTTPFNGHGLPLVFVYHGESRARRATREQAWCCQVDDPDYHRRFYVLGLPSLGVEQTYR